LTQTYQLIKIYAMSLILICLTSCSTYQTQKINKITPIEPSVTQKPQLSLPGNAYYHYMESQLCKRENNLVAYINHLKKAAQMDDAVYLKKELANAYIKAKEYTNALEILVNIAEQSPDHFDTWLLMGGIYQAMDKMDKAISSYETALRLKPDKENIYLLIAELYQKSEQIEPAKDIYRRLIKINPKSHIAYFFLGQIEKNQGNLDAAVSHFKMVCKLSPKTLQPQFELAHIYIEQNRDKKVVRTFRNILDKEPDNIHARIELGSFYFKKGSLKKARKTFLGIVEKLKQYPQLIKKIAAHFFEKKQHDVAVFTLETLQKELSRSNGIHYYLGIHYEENNQDEKALVSYQRIESTSEYFENAALRMAYLFQKKGKFQQAVDLIEQLISNAPDDIELYLFLGSIHEEAQAYEKAEITFKEGLAIDDTNYKLLFRLGVVYDKWGKKEESINQMKRVIELHPNNANALNYLGYTYADKGIHLDEAETLIRKALKQKPDDGYIMDSLGWVYFRRGQYDEAEIFLNKAIKLVPEDPIILEHMGDVYEKLNQLRTALNYYEKALKFQKEPKNRQSIEQKIQDIYSTSQSKNGKETQLNNVKTNTN